MSQISGQKTVPTPGTALALGSLNCNCAVLVKALNGNTGVVYVGNDGNDDVSSTTGVVLLKNDYVLFNYVGDLEDIYVDVATGNDGVAWILLDTA